MQIRPELPLYFDSTMRSAFVSCPRKFYNEFVLGLRGGDEVSIDLHAGGCIAHCFETVYNLIYLNHVAADKALELGRIQFEIDWGDVEPKIVKIKKDGTPQWASPKTKDRCWDAIVDYFKKYPPLFDHIKPMRLEDRTTIEFTFAIPLTKGTLGYEVPRHPSGDPFLYSGRMDFIGKWKDMIIPVDHKTGSRRNPNWSEQWDLRSQFMGYVWACEQIGFNVQRHFAVRGIIILTEEIIQLEAIKSYTRGQLDRWRGQLARDMHRLVDCYNSGYFDYDFAESCTMFGRLCPYFHACRSDDPEVWLKDMKKRYWNPLNKNPDAEPPPTLWTPIVPEPKLVEPTP